MFVKCRFSSMTGALFTLMALLPLQGCSIGYLSLHPGENSALYAHLFSDVINVYDEPHWLWIRGSISGDLNGDGLVSEEAVIATIQKGDERKPGPIEMAFLVVCEINPEGKRTAISRTVVFERNPMPEAPRPVHDLARTGERSLTRVRAQMVQDKISLKETIVLYFYGDDMPGDVWYVGYALENNRLTKNLEIALWQRSPGFLVSDLDRDIESRRKGYQLVFGVSALPEEVVQDIPPPRDIPLWGHVFARDDDGTYRQADERFGIHYRTIENQWNQMYLKALFQEMPPEKLAWFEYHMGIMNHYTDNPDLGARLLEKARKGAKDPLLREAVRKAMAAFAGPDPGQQ